MTTIVYRDGVMAADTRGYGGSAAPIGQKQKIHRLPDGGLLGVSSTEPGVPEAFVAWMAAGGSIDELERMGERLNLQALHVNAAGNVFYYSDNFIPSGPLFAPFFAIGSGGKYALGAMTCGATADGAIAAAMQHDLWTGGEVMQVPLVEPEPANDDLPPIEIVEAEVVEDAPKPVKKRKSRKSKAT